MAAQVRKTATKLADGRDFFYFDDAPAYVSGEKTRRLDDPRPLVDRFAPVENLDGTLSPISGPQMRQDPLTGDWIPMATHRMNRTFLPPADANPLAPARPGASYQDGEIPDTDYDVVVFENRFPSLLSVPGECVDQIDFENEALWQARPAAGRCEVICFGPRVDQSLSQMGPKRMRTVIEAWADRTAELSHQKGIEQVFCFENHGKEIGVTLHHPHGQIYAYPFVPPYTARVLARAQAYRKETGKNLLRETMEAEIRSGRRVIEISEHWALYVPMAARWPVEVHLAPLRDVPDLAALNDAEREDLAHMYLKVLNAGNRFFSSPKDCETGRETKIELPYIAAWHQAPIGEGREDMRLFLQFFSFLRAPGKLKYLAGSESGEGAWISDTSPEKIADRFKEIYQKELS